MRKKHLCSLFAIIMVAMLSMSFTSCSDDDDSNSLKGTTWVASDPEDDYVSSISFTSNTTGTIKYDDGDDDIFWYTSEGKSGTINISGSGYNPHTFTISGSIMQVTDNEGDLYGVYQRK